MASGSESAAVKGVTEWEVGPMEDVVQALLETLVDPLLPLRASNGPPSEDVEKSVAKQVHAVVLLYNYYHRKQKSELLFLDFLCFCQLAMVIRPPLIAFLKLMKGIETTNKNGAQDLFSVTEKAIKDACDISEALDATRDAPNLVGWPISKVAVLLIDSTRKYCMLQYDNVAKGTWSLIEKEPNESSINPEISPDEIVGSKRKRSYQTTLTCDTEILQLAYDAVKGVTGINSSDLEVLESHVTYSLSKAKSATRFYMMQCAGSITKNEQVPIKFLVESLQGPLAEKLAHNFWKSTPVVEFRHLLPYVEFISSWLSRNDSCLASSSSCNTQSITNGCEELSRSRKSSLTLPNCNGSDFDQIDNGSSRMEADTIDEISSENCFTEKDGNLTDKSSKNCDTLDLAEDSRKLIAENLGNDTKQPDKSSLSGPSSGRSQALVNVDGVLDKLKNGCDPSSRISVEISDNDDQKGLISCPSEQLSERMVLDDNVTVKFNENPDVGSSEDKDALSGSSRGLRSVNTGDLTNIGTKSEDAGKRLNSKIIVYHHRRKVKSSAQNDAQLRADGSSLKDKVESDHNQVKYEKVSVDNCCQTDTRNQTSSPETVGQPAQAEATTKCNIEEHSAPYSDLLQNALSLLSSKRKELYSQICNMEDTLALCEGDIVRIRDGREIALAHECIESLISGKYRPLFEHGAQVEDKGNKLGGKSQNEKPARLSEAYLLGMSPCRDLEYTCLKNNWRMPRYLTVPSDGKFLSNVVVEGEGFKFHAKGSSASQPDEARDSAAAEMIVIMRNASLGSSDV